MQRRRLLASLGSAFLLVAACSGPPGDPGEDASLIVGRAWFSKKPENPREWVHQLVLWRRPVRGAVAQATLYKLAFEVFEYERDGATVRVTFPQDGRKGSFDYKITACDEDGFDLCLELSQNPWSGPKKYYGMRDANAALPAGLAERARMVTSIVDAPP